MKEKDWWYVESLLAVSDEFKKVQRTLSDTGTTCSGVLSPTSSCSEQQDEKEESCDSEKGTEPITTLMISSLPRHYDIGEIISLLHECKSASTYDMVYVPKKAKRAAASKMTHVFVNFKTPEDATTFLAAFENVSSPDIPPGLSCCVKPARIQGYKANMQIYGQRPSLAGNLITCPDSSSK
jgi:hypothetical protein